MKWGSPASFLTALCEHWQTRLAIGERKIDSGHDGRKIKQDVFELAPFIGVA